MTTGTRLPDGTVLVRCQHFEVQTGQNVVLKLVFLKKDISLPIIGTVDTPLSLSLLDQNTGTLSLSNFHKDRNLVLAWLEPEREPTKHLLRELRELKAQYDKLDAQICLIIGEDKHTIAFSPEVYQGLPNGCIFALDDRSYSTLSSMEKSHPLSITREYPIVYILDRQSQIRFHSAGYKLGTGREVLQALKELD